MARSDTTAASTSLAHPQVIGTPIKALGFAGLLPQVIALGLELWTLPGSPKRDGAFSASAELAAFAYGGVILSFIGGIWWAFAVQRRAGQARLALLAVVPSLLAVALFGSAMILGIRVALVMLGSAIMLTLLVDRELVATGEAPAQWMRLRVPLSLGLGTLTILAGIVAPR